MPTDTTCPNCNAPYARKLSLIYDEGLSTGQSQSISTGSTNTIVKIKLSTTESSTSVQQTRLSKSAAPPAIYIPSPQVISKGGQLKEKVLVMGIIASILLPTLAMNMFNTFFGFMGTIIGAILMTIVISMLIDTKLTDEEQVEYDKLVSNQKKALENWNNTYACNVCGHHFISDENK